MKSKIQLGALTVFHSKPNPMKSLPTSPQQSVERCGLPLTTSGWRDGALSRLVPSPTVGRWFCLGALLLCAGLVSEAQPAAPADLDYHAPWPEAERQGLWPRSDQAQPPPATGVAPPTASSVSPQSPPPVADLLSPTAPAIQAPKATKHEISVSADYLLGQGDVTLPLGFSLAKVPGLGANIVPNVAKPDRDSDYYGATISYSFGQAWYLDLGYARGTSSGDVDVLLGPPPALPSSFKIDDTLYQAYVRYTFPRLRGKRLSIYLRAGVSLVEAELTDTTTIPALGLYKQTDDTRDILGNLGFGVGYSLYTSRRVRLGLQVEGEGFYGQRSQDSLEVLPQAGPGFPFKTAKIDNDLYGGIGRGTLRFEYRLGQSGLFKIFADGGAQVKYTTIDYSGLGSYDEILWGPYVKVGMRYAF